MGFCQSYLKQQKETKINNLDVLNKSIANLNLLQKEENKQIQILEKRKIAIQKEIEDCNLDLCIIRKEKKDILETIKLFECKICMDKQNEVMLIPCGHCFCSNCSTNMSNCPICRSNIINTNQIYFN